LTYSYDNKPGDYWYLKNKHISTNIKKKNSTNKNSIRDSSPMIKSFRITPFKPNNNYKTVDGVTKIIEI